MSALAQLLLDLGHSVSGSDRLLDSGDLTPALACLQKQGVRLWPQDGSALSAKPQRVLVSTAIEDDNPEVLAARQLGVPLVHRAAALAEVAEGRELIAITGTSGKSSVTAVLGTLLEGAGFDPLVVNGAVCRAWSGGGDRLGSVRKPCSWQAGGSSAGGWMVVEADESDRSLSAFSPRHAIITNVAADHFDLAESEALFDQFKGGVSGLVIDGRREEFLPEEIRQEGWQSSFTHEGVEYRVPLPGLHNLLNSWQALRMALMLGAQPELLVKALAGFGGVERRLELVGECHGAMVVDDYAHNTAKLQAAWQTLTAAFPVGVSAVWRPHGYAPLRRMMADLVETLATVCRPQDRLLLLPVYDAGGTARRSVSSMDLALALERKGVNICCVESLAQAEELLRAEARPGRVLATLGARDPALPRLAGRLAGHPAGGQA